MADGPESGETKLALNPKGVARNGKTALGLRRGPAPSRRGSKLIRCLKPKHACREVVGKGGKWHDGHLTT